MDEYDGWNGVHNLLKSSSQWGNHRIHMQAILDIVLYRGIWSGNSQVRIR